MDGTGLDCRRPSVSRTHADVWRLPFAELQRLVDDAELIPASSPSRYPRTITRC
jgi:hypothetical protein